MIDPVFAELKALIVAETGHHYYDDKDDQLAERIDRRMAALGIKDRHIYLERLRDAAAGPREWRLLEGELTIKETFFFRFAEQFAALRTHLLPRLIAAHEGDRTLRIWSAGCSIGAEPYSLAVLVRDLLGDAVNDWTVTILGTDLDQAALDRATEGVFGDWALRTMPAPERARLFDAQGGSGGGKWRLKPVYRAMVRFERQNILDIAGADAPLGRDAYDLILCRNLLIYFRQDVATDVVTALGDRLAPAGWLLLGHAEAGVAGSSGLVPADIAGVVAYRRPATSPEVEIARAAPSRVATRRRAPRTRPQAPPRPRLAPIAAGAPPDDGDTIRVLLSRGDTAAARAAIAAARAVAPDDARLLYLDGLAALAQQDKRGAERALRGALYLDPGLAMAHYLLGRELLGSGRVGDGRRGLANAAEAIRALSDDDPVPEGDGMTAADLRDAIRHDLAQTAGAA